MQKSPLFKKPVKKNILLFVPYIAIFFVVSFTQAFQSADKGEADGNLRLQKFVVVALGFERVCFRLVNGVGF